MTRQIIVWLVVLAAFLSAVEARKLGVFYRSNERDVGIETLCQEISVTSVSCTGFSDENELLSHPDDCRLFYQCVHGAAACRQCPAGLHFNQALRVCDLPQNAGCVGSGVNGAAVQPGVGHDDIPQRCIDHTVTAVSCAGVDAPHSLLPHPYDCQLFYYCVGEQTQPVCRQCPAGLHFNPDKSVCDVPDEAGCHIELPSTPFPQRLKLLEPLLVGNNLE